MKQMTITATIDNLDQVLDFINAALEEMLCPPRTQIQIDIAVEEIFVNIANYAYQDHEGEASIIFEVQKEEPVSVLITFIDSGIPYDPLKKADPDITLSAEEREIGGLGIYMVKKSMDNVSYQYRNGQNVLTIEKHLT